VFSLLLLGIGLSLALYGKWFFGSNELISGGTREYVMSKTQPVRAQRQMSLKQGANPSDDQISKYCTCVSIQIADNTTGAGEDGWAAADAAARAMVGQKLKPSTPVTTLMVTKNNFNKIPGGKGNYDGPIGYKVQFQKLWGKR